MTCNFLQLAEAGKKERSGQSPDRAGDVFSTEMKRVCFN